ncbi:hypothetical protein GCM10011390_31500 [Aureimonas endophytica]|uniref:Uncharacterized protein n=1 Tax=Aureimonas endophytica TaxID=2027858 RepID=A0A917E6W0_9HYPH|nr:hypothetical protein [Aureimonas endophytica]GGE10172.1 hypothetical protein GCM10011390_31500 [Aureimonas endophytica]
MSHLDLSPAAGALLDQLRAHPSVAVFDQEAAEELVARGFACHIPAIGTIEATESGRLHSSGGLDEAGAGTGAGLTAPAGTPKGAEGEARV